MSAQSKAGRLRAAVLELLAQHERDGALPTSARFLFYELVQLGVISKERTGSRRPDQDMIEALTNLRQSGQVPWNWIADETRSLDDYTGSPTIKDWMLAVLPQARLDPLAGEAPLILTESRSLAGVLRGLAKEHCVQIAPTNGQCAGFLRKEEYQVTSWNRPPPPENSAARTGSPSHSTEPELQSESYHQEAATQELPRDNHGYLHRCSKRHDRAPDMSGEARIASIRCQLAAWVKVSRRGKQYLNLKFTPVDSDD